MTDSKAVTLIVSKKRKGNNNQQSFNGLELPDIGPVIAKITEVLKKGKKKIYDRSCGCYKWIDG